MLNLAIFIKCPENKNADYNRQQVSERGVLGFIDSFNESMMEKFDLNYDMMIHMYELLHNAEVSLQKNANDPRVKKALNDFTNNKVAAAIGNKEPEPEPEPAGEDKEDNGISGEPGVSGDEALKKAEAETLKEAEELIEGKEMENKEPAPEPEPEPAPEHEPEKEDMKEEAPTQEPAPEPEPEKEDVKEENNAPEPEPENESEAPSEKAAPKAKRTTKKKAE